MEVKLLEVRDDGTLVPVMCIKPVARDEAETWLMERGGFGETPEKNAGYVFMTWLAPGIRTEYDRFEWTGSRTKHLAHEFIEQHWAELKSGDVVDVEHILGEKPEKKVSERLTVKKR